MKFAPLATKPEITLPASATNIVTRHGKDKMSWQSVDRTLGGVTIPGIDEFTVVRKPPAAGK